MGVRLGVGGSHALVYPLPGIDYTKPPPMDAAAVLEALGGTDGPYARSNKRSDGAAAGVAAGGLVGGPSGAGGVALTHGPPGAAGAGVGPGIFADLLAFPPLTQQDRKDPLTDPAVDWLAEVAVRSAGVDDVLSALINQQQQPGAEAAAGDAADGGSSGGGGASRAVQEQKLAMYLRRVLLPIRLQLVWMYRSKLLTRTKLGGKGGEGGEGGSGARKGGRNQQDRDAAEDDMEGSELLAGLEDGDGEDKAGRGQKQQVKLEHVKQEHIKQERGEPFSAPAVSAAPGSANGMMPAAGGGHGETQGQQLSLQGAGGRAARNVSESGPLGLQQGGVMMQATDGQGGQLGVYGSRRQAPLGAAAAGRDEEGGLGSADGGEGGPKFAAELRAEVEQAAVAAGLPLVQVLVGFKEDTPGAGEILDQWMVSGSFFQVAFIEWLENRYCFDMFILAVSCLACELGMCCMLLAERAACLGLLQRDCILTLLAKLACF